MQLKKYFFGGSLLLNLIFFGQIFSAFEKKLPVEVGEGSLDLSKLVLDDSGSGKKLGDIKQFEGVETLPESRDSWDFDVGSLTDEEQAEEIFAQIKKTEKEEKEIHYSKAWFLILDACKSKATIRGDIQADGCIALYIAISGESVKRLVGSIVDKILTDQRFTESVIFILRELLRDDDNAKQIRDALLREECRKNYIKQVEQGESLS